MIACNLETCKEKYIGESERTLKDIISEHVGYIRTNKGQNGTSHGHPGSYYHYVQKVHNFHDVHTTY